MAQSVIGALRVNLGLDSAKFEKGATRAEKRLKGMASSFKRAAAVAGAFGAAMTALAVRAGNQIDAQAKLARVLGTTTASIQALDRAAQLSGVSFGEVEAGAARLTRRLALAAQGTGPAAGVFKRLGLRIKELQALPLDERIIKINDAIAEMIPKTEQAATASKIFGDRGFAAFQQLTTENIRKAQEDIERMGLAVSEFDAGRIEEANDQISSLGLVAKAAGKQLATALVPALGSMADALTRAFERGKPLRAVLDALTNNITIVIGAVTGAVAVLGVRLVGAFVMVRAQAVAATFAMKSFRAALLSTGFGTIVVALGAVAGALFATELGFDNNTRALGDEKRALKSNILALKSGQTMSKNMAQAKIAEIKTRRENIAAITDENRALLGQAQRDRDAAAKILEFEQTGVNAFGVQTGEVDRERTEFAKANLADAKARITQLKAQIEEAGISTAQAEKAMAALEQAVAGAGSETVKLGDEFDNIIEPSERIQREFQGIEDAGGGASKGVDKLGDSLSDAEQRAQSFNKSFGQTVAVLISGSNSISNVLSRLGEQLLGSAFSGLSESLGLGDFFGGLFSFDGGGYTGSGSRTGGVDGKGGFPALLHPEETVIDHTKGQGAGGGAVQVDFIVVNNVEGAEVQKRRERGPDGREVLVAEINKAAAAGELDTGFGGRFGSKPQTVPR